MDMRIAVIRQECSFSKGGAERYAANLCGSLARAGHEVVVVAETFDPDIHPGIVHVPVKVNRASSASRTRSFHKRSQQAVAGLKADAVLALSRTFPADAFRVSDPLHRYWMEIRYPGPVRRFIERLNPRHRAILALEDGIFNPANTRMVVTNSLLSKKLIGERYSYPAERIHVVYNGVDLETFSPSPDIGEKATDPIRLLFVGQDFRRKGLAPLLEALALVRGHTPSLRVIGRDDPAPYRALAKSLGIADRVSFEGPSGKIQEAYRNADLFVFPTFYDPFANVCLEALACGLPVLTTSTNGSSELVVGDVEGYVVDGAEAGLAERLAAKINRFCGLPAQARTAMRHAARTKAQNFTIAANAETVVRLLSSGKGGE